MNKMKDSKNSTNLGCGRFLSDSTLTKKNVEVFGEVYHTQGSNPHSYVEVLVGSLTSGPPGWKKMEGLQKMLPLWSQRNMSSWLTFRPVVVYYIMIMKILFQRLSQSWNFRETYQTLKPQSLTGCFLPLDDCSWSPNTQHWQACRIMNVKTNTPQHPPQKKKQILPSISSSSGHKLLVVASVGNERSMTLTIAHLLPNRTLWFVIEKHTSLEAEFWLSWKKEWHLEVLKIIRCQKKNVLLLVWCCSFGSFGYCEKVRVKIQMALQITPYSGFVRR